MTDFIIAIVLLAAVLLALGSAKKHFRGQGGCCGGSTYQARSRKLAKVVDRKTFTVEGMTCQHCVNRVMEAVQDIPGTSAAVNLKKGQVTVSTDTPMDEAQIKAAIEKAGYPVK